MRRAAPRRPPGPARPRPLPGPCSMPPRRFSLSSRRATPFPPPSPSTRPHAPLAAPNAAAAARPSSVAPASRRLLDAAQALQPLLEAGHPFSTAQLREAMARAFGASDAAGAWDWKAAYDACEAAQILLLRRYGGALATQNRSPQRVLAMWERLAARIPTQTRRSEEGQSLQQF